MLKLVSVKNISKQEVLNTRFDVGIFASGYETRAVALAQEVDLSLINYKISLGFSEYMSDPVRVKNDAFYNSKGFQHHIVSANNERTIYSGLIALFGAFKDKKEINILLDYTSMSRLWYSGILNFIRLQDEKKINVYLNYSLGEYTEELMDSTYTSVNSIPSYEGSLSLNRRTLLVLAIGFSPYLVKSVLEEIEPNDVIGILPIPNVKKEYEKRSEYIKNQYLSEDINEWINCSVDDLEGIFRTFAEISNHNISKKNILFLSLGPKIYTLASILVSQRFEHITSLYLRDSGLKKMDIKPTGNYICSHVTYGR